MTARLVNTRMTARASSRRHRDPITGLFASALGGDIRAEHDLRELAVHNDRAAEALCALAYAADIPDARPADVAVTERTVAAVIDAISRMPRSA